MLTVMKKDPVKTLFICMLRAVAHCLNRGTGLAGCFVRRIFKMMILSHFLSYLY